MAQQELKYATSDQLRKVIEKHLLWRKSDGKRGGRADLSLFDLTEAKLAGANLAGANLAGANLARANLAGANLTEAKLAWANLWGANITKAILKDANLAGANLEEAKLNGANLWGASLVWANLVGANLEEANLWGANLTGANLVGANLWGANLVWANLVGANLEEANLWGANLTGANLYRAGLLRTKLKVAKIEGANFYGSDTTDIDLDEEMTQFIANNHPYVGIAPPGINKIVLAKSEDMIQQKLTPDFLIAELGPYLNAIAELQHFIDEMQERPHSQIYIRSIIQHSPIGVEMSGVGETYKAIREDISGWRKDNAKKLVRLDEIKRKFELKIKQVEIKEREASITKDEQEAAKLSAEARKIDAEAKLIEAKAEKIRAETKQRDLAFKILIRCAPKKLVEELKTNYVEQLLQPVRLISESNLADD